MTEASTMTPKYPHITVHLSGKDGNAFSILARTRMVMRQHGVDPDEVATFSKEAMSGDYNDLLGTVMRWVNVE